LGCSRLGFPVVVRPSLIIRTLLHTHTPGAENEQASKQSMSRQPAPSRKQRYAKQNADQLTLLTPEIRQRVLPILESALHDREWNAVCGYAGQLFALVHKRTAAVREEFKETHPTEREAEQHATNLRMLGLTMLDCKVLMALAFDGLNMHAECLEFAQDALNVMEDSQVRVRVESIRDKMVRLLILRSELQLQLGGSRGKARQLAKDNARRWRDLKRYGEEIDVDLMSTRALEAHMTGKHGDESRLLEQLWRWMHLSCTPKIERFVAVAERADAAVPPLTLEQAQRSNVKSPIVFGDLPTGKYRFWVHAITADGNVLASTRATSNTVVVRPVASQQDSAPAEPAASADQATSSPSSSSCSSSGKAATPTELFWKPVNLVFPSREGATKGMLQLDDIEWKAPARWTTTGGKSYVSLQFQPPTTFQLVHSMDDRLNPLADKSLIDELVQRHLQLYNWNARLLADRLMTSYRLQNRGAEAKRVGQQFELFSGTQLVQAEDAENDEARLFPAEGVAEEEEEEAAAAAVTAASQVQQMPDVA
jgi:hypothetical protein